MPAGVKMMLNSGEPVCTAEARATPTLAHIGEFYGPDGSPANLELLARFFKKYPEYANKTFLSVKVGLLSMPYLVI